MNRKISMNITISAKPERIFAALTSVEDVEGWFAEEAEISIEQGQYNFWGKYTPENPDKERGAHSIEKYEEGKNLRFKWRLRDADTWVEYEIEEEGDGAVVRLSHSGLKVRGKGEFAVANFWSVTLENLRAWVEQGKAGMRCDFSMVSIGDVKLQIDIDASSKQVFDALILPEELDRYMGKGSVVEPIKGGQYNYGWGEGPIKILEIEENTRLSFSWKYKTEPDTVVTWELEGSGGNTRLTIVHSGFGDEISDDYRIGWMEFMNIIKMMVETGPEWKKLTIISEDYEPCEA